MPSSANFSSGVIVLLLLVIRGDGRGGTRGRGGHVPSSRLSRPEDTKVHYTQAYPRCGGSNRDRGAREGGRRPLGGVAHPPAPPYPGYFRLALISSQWARQRSRAATTSAGVWAP